MERREGSSTLAAVPLNFPTAPAQGYEKVTCVLEIRCCNAPLSLWYHGISDVGPRLRRNRVNFPFPTYVYAT